MSKKTPTASEETKPGNDGPTADTVNEPTSSSNPASREADDPEATPAQAADANNDGSVSAEEAAIAPIVEAQGGTASPEVQRRIDQTLANTGDTPKPEYVNGQYVGDKVYDEETDTWVKDPDAAVAAETRPSDIFDRIGDAFMHERQRGVIEEIARFVGMTPENTRDLPDGMPALKSTASLRTDVSGYGGYASGGPGPKPVGPGQDGESLQGDDTEKPTEG